MGADSVSAKGATGEGAVSMVGPLMLDPSWFGSVGSIASRNGLSGVEPWIGRASGDDSVTYRNPRTAKIVTTMAAAAAATMIFVMAGMVREMAASG